MQLLSKIKTIVLRSVLYSVTLCLTSLYVSMAIDAVVIPGVAHLSPEPTAKNMNISWISNFRSWILNTPESNETLTEIKADMQQIERRYSWGRVGLVILGNKFAYKFPKDSEALGTRVGSGEVNAQSQLPFIPLEVIGRFNRDAQYLYDTNLALFHTQQPIPQETGLQINRLRCIIRIQDQVHGAMLIPVMDRVPNAQPLVDYTDALFQGVDIAQNADVVNRFGINLAKLINASLVGNPIGYYTALVHGDLHPGNVLIDTAIQTMHLIDVDRFTRGDPAVDIAFFICLAVQQSKDRIANPQFHVYFQEFVTNFYAGLFSSLNPSYAEKLREILIFPKLFDHISKAANPRANYIPEFKRDYADLFQNPDLFVAIHNAAVQRRPEEIPLNEVAQRENNQLSSNTESADWVSFYTNAESLKKMGKHKEALTGYEAALETALAPEDKKAEIYNKMGLCYWVLEDSKKAEEAFKTALELCEDGSKLKEKIAKNLKVVQPKKKNKGRRKKA